MSDPQFYSPETLAERWACSPCDRIFADWKTHGRAAGPIRNQRMIDEWKPTLVIAFAGGRGTADMIRRAKAAGIEVREVPAPPLSSGEMA